MREAEDISREESYGKIYAVLWCLSIHLHVDVKESSSPYLKLTKEKLEENYM